MLQRISTAWHLTMGLLLPMAACAWFMWTLHDYIVDDSYISFRYARNFAEGHGLVYNVGEAVEGYTNFLWTLMLGIGMTMGVSPEWLSQFMGGTFALGAVGCTWLLSRRLAPFVVVPCLATWMMATSITFAGYAMFGLESSLFIFLVVWGALLLVGEEQDDRRIPWSGLVFALAALTRPEAPMFMGIFMLALGRRFFTRRNILRGVVFLIPVVIHLLWRHGYYGEWLPNTLAAKTGDGDRQLEKGIVYVRDFVRYQGPLVWLAPLGLGIALVKRERWLGATCALATAIMVYVTLVGGDWMPYFRFMGPAEPFLYLAAGLGLRAMGDTRSDIRNALLVGLALVFVTTGYARIKRLNEAREVIVTKKKAVWDRAAGGVADWFLHHNKPGTIAMADIGYIGYKTNYPVWDTLGLVTTDVSSLEGGYGSKLGPEFLKRFHARDPDYAILIANGRNCRKPTKSISKTLYKDAEFRRKYEPKAHAQVTKTTRWCIYGRRDKPTVTPKTRPTAQRRRPLGPRR